MSNGTGLKEERGEGDTVEGWGGVKGSLCNTGPCIRQNKRPLKQANNKKKPSLLLTTVCMPYILETLLLLQESQLLLPLLTNPRDKWIEKPELFTVLVHLEVGVLKHNFKSIIHEDIRKALQERQGPV